MIVLKFLTSKQALVRDGTRSQLFTPRKYIKWKADRLLCFKGFHLKVGNLLKDSFLKYVII